MNNPQIPISWGELLDKITILQIKLVKLRSKSALDNVDNELGQLDAIFSHDLSNNANLNDRVIELKSINQKLWDIEDRIRDKERNKCFDEEFIQLARSVYFTNDERSRIKKQINDILGSELIEEKSYTDYE